MVLIILVILFFLFPFRIKIIYDDFYDKNKKYDINIFKYKLSNKIYKKIKNKIINKMKQKKKYYLEFEDKYKILKYILNKKIVNKINLDIQLNFSMFNIFLANLINIIFPIFNNLNIVTNYKLSINKLNKIYFNCIFRFNLVNIIYIVIFYNLKKKRVIENYGTSNRRFNEKCNVIIRKYD